LTRDRLGEVPHLDHAATTDLVQQLRESRAVAGQSRRALWDRVGDVGRAIVCCLLCRRCCAGPCCDRSSAE